MINILLTGIGCPGTSGTLECLAAAHEEITLSGCDAQSVPGFDEFESTWVVPPADHKDYVTDVIEICKRDRIDVILPQTTAEVEVLSRTKTRRLIQNETGAVVAAAPGYAVKRANDKATLMTLAHQFKIPAPKFWTVEKVEDLLNYPLDPYIVKPRRGNGSRGVRLVSLHPLGNCESFISDKTDGMNIDRWHLHAILEEGEFPELLAMEYLPGAEFSVDCFRGRDVEAAVVRQRIKTRTGISVDTCTLGTTSLEALIMAPAALLLAKHLGLFGVFGFQFKTDDNGTPKVIDCNPRVQGTMVASLYAGLNAPYLAVREALGDHPSVIELSSESHRYVRRWSGGPVISELENV